MTTLDVPEATLDAITAFYSFNHIPPAEHADFIVKTAIWLRPVGLLLACLRTGGSNDNIEHWLGVPMFFASHDQDTNRPHLGVAVVSAEKPTHMPDQREHASSHGIWPAAALRNLEGARV